MSETTASAREHIMSMVGDQQTWAQCGVDIDGLVDKVLDAVIEVHDEIEGAQIVVSGPGKDRRTLTVHTSDQVVEWLYGLMKNRTA